MTEQPEFTTLSIVIPVYNEAGTWRRLLDRAEAVEIPLARQLVIVDDGSTDGTRDQLRRLQADRPDVTVVFHDRNRGKGAALRTGFEHALGEVVIVQDADLEYDPRDYPRLLAPILAGEADVVYGSRFARRHRRQRSWHAAGNKLLTLLSNLATGGRLTDMETCYKLLPAEVLRRVTLEQNRFGFEPEITAKIAALGVRVREVPIRYAGRTYAEGKKIGWRDGVEALYCIAKYALRRVMR